MNHYHLLLLLTVLFGLTLLEADKTDRLADVSERSHHEYAAIMAVPMLFPPVGRRVKRGKDWNKGSKP